MRVPIVVLLSAACSGSDADPTRAGSAAPLVIAAPAIGSDAAAVVAPKLTYADLMAVKGQDIFPGIDWNATYTQLVKRFGPVTRVVDRKYFWAATENDLCAMFWIGRRKHLEQVALAVGVSSSGPGGIGHDWCIAMATGGPLPPRSERQVPSTGPDTPTPE